MTAKNNENTKIKRPHNLSLENRNKIVITGIIDVISATETQILAKSDFGPLSISGHDLKVTTLSIDNGVIEANGEINKIEYNKSKKSMFEKVFK